MSASRRLALAAAALALAGLAALWAHILSPSFGGANECEMTYMRPGYLPVPLPSTLANDRGYALFLYREGMSRVSSGDARREVGRLGEPRPDGTRATPAIFLPGNGGSFKQVRSVGSESHRVSGERARGRDATRQKNDDSNANANVSNEPIPYLDWFAVSFGEELSAFHGALLEDQIAFAARAIEHVASLYVVQRRTAHGHLPTGESHSERISSVPLHVAILGHSMGGLVARGALLDARLGNRNRKPPLAFSLVTLASPHAYSPATTTKGAARRHARMNEAWRVGHAAARGDASLRHVALASVAGGDRDRQVLASHASVVGVVDARFGFEVDAGDVPTARGVSADHQCVVWCNQVIKAVANALIDAARVMSHVSHAEKSEADEPSGGGAEGRGEASYDPTAYDATAYDATATATAARRAALASRLVGELSEPGRSRRYGRSLVIVRGLARGALRWTPSLVPATVSAAFALAGAAEGSYGKRPSLYRRGARARDTGNTDTRDTRALLVAGFGTLASCLACAWLPAVGAAAGAAARVVLLRRAANQSRRTSQDDPDPSFLARETYRCVAHVVAALATLPSAAAAALCAWHAAGTVGATKARTSVFFASPFLRGGEDAWWALAAAAPAWLGRGTGFVSESATPAAVAPLADALDSAALFAAAAVAAGAAVPGRAHETQTAAALAGVGAAVAALAGRLGFFLVKTFRRGAGAGKTKTG